MLPILIATFLGGCVLGAFTVLVVGVHIEEHRRGASAMSNIRPSELAARQVMGVHVRKPSQIPNSDQKRK
jgi:hypothetical protein